MKLSELLKKRKNAKQNAGRLRYKLDIGKPTNCRPEFWDQVARDYTIVINRLKSHVCANTNEPECYDAPIVGLRCNNCKQPI